MPIDKDQIYESATEMLYTIISRINKQEIVYLSSATGQSALTGSPQEISGVREVEQIIHPFDPPALEAELNVAISAQRNLDYQPNIHCRHLVMLNLGSESLLTR